MPCSGDCNMGGSFNRPVWFLAWPACAENTMLKKKTAKITEFGDFQTPEVLALAATRLLHSLGIRPRCVLEPTCGRGAFLGAAATTFPDAERLIGVEINSHHL